ncbi:MAG: hypothetical protein HYX36_04730 [Rhizobiales bacterium]|nr:hypothetical protein [Hyphomicrobiales bacterium]
MEHRLAGQFEFYVAAPTLNFECQDVPPCCPAKARLRWLGLQDTGKSGGEFWPQTYEICARVLREMGRPDEARNILIEKECLLRQTERNRTPAPRRQLKWLRDRLLGATIRYGHAPMQAIVWLADFWIFGSLIFGLAYSNGAIKPTPATSLPLAAWKQCSDVAGESRGDCFLRQPDAVDFPRFNSAVFAIDTLVPAVSMNMRGNWTPDESKPIGRVVQIYLWIQVLVGWALTFLTVAGFSGLVKFK